MKESECLIVVVPYKLKEEPRIGAENVVGTARHAKSGPISEHVGVASSVQDAGIWNG